MQQTHRWTLRKSRWTLWGSLLGHLTFFCFVNGCATTPFGQAITHYAKKTAVTDAAARHTSVSPYYRFNAVLLSDLDDAIACTDVPTQRKLTAAVLRGANTLSQSSSANEIERMPITARQELGRLEPSHLTADNSPENQAYLCASMRESRTSRYTKDDMVLASITGASTDVVVLQHRFSTLANAALDCDLRDVDRLSPSALRLKLQALRDGVEELPDDRGRLERKVLYAWAAPLTARGIAKEEAKLPEKCRAKVEKTFDRVAIWRPSFYAGNALIKKYAPIIGMEWPKNRMYDDDYDRIGAVGLTSNGERIKVRIDPTRPTVYSYTTVAKINGQRFQQLNYVWWFAERPEMTQDDPVAGHIDGAMVRITLDANDHPMFIESSKNCGCSHEVFVSDNVESDARQFFGTPITGKHFAVEKSMPNKHDIVVLHTFDAMTNTGRPLVLSAAGYHEVYQLKFNATQAIGDLHVMQDRSYRILDYDNLDRLPLDGGIASMFGPDGLVHYAGRPEGILLSPSGMLSAGQPRKRGTQRVRWDDFLHDDPHLLENTLRIPPLN